MSVPFHVDLIGVATRDFWALWRTNDVPRLLAGILLSLQMKRVDQAQPYLHYLDNLMGGTAGIFQRLCAAFGHFVFLCFVLGRGAFPVPKKKTETVSVTAAPKVWAWITSTWLYRGRQVVSIVSFVSFVPFVSFCSLPQSGRITFRNLLFKGVSLSDAGGATSYRERSFVSSIAPARWSLQRQNSCPRVEECPATDSVQLWLFGDADQLGMFRAKAGSWLDGDGYEPRTANAFGRA